MSSTLIIICGKIWLNKKEVYINKVEEEYEKVKEDEKNEFIGQLFF